MPRKKTETAISPVVLESRIHIIRGLRVMLDSDLAELYGVATKVLNQAVDRNPERFPDDFSFILTDPELVDLRSQIVTSKKGRGGRRYLPRVFTEQGVAMLSSVLRSETAVRVNIEIMRAFIRIRHLFAVPGEFVVQLQELAKTVQLHDGQIRAIIDTLQQMMEPLPEPTRGKFGFPLPEHSKESK
jgi:hypothetical protein